jgi:class 3 adenylate cyclase/tetratricopeptide (TPR) repeat protein
MQCPRCQAQNDQDAKFCEDCGARLDAVCPSCGQPVGTGKKFCRSCGASLIATTSRFTSPQAYTPKHLAEKILTSKAALEGERKLVTVLFADLKGSMELLADRDPEEARKLLDPVLEHMIQAVHRYEGTVNQVMGDGIMALFGAPVAHEDHAVRACYAALRMQESVGHYAEEVLRSQGIRVQIRVGLNSGEVVVRAIGSDLHMDYTAVGQTTHLAARMEQMAAPGTILLAPATVRLAEDYIQVAPQGPIPVKGLPDPVDTHILTGAVARTRLQAGVARGLTAFVGRDPEMEQIRRALNLARSGHGQLVAVVGEPGVGKSRLFHEFIRSVGDQECRVLEAGSVSYGKVTSYLPVINLLKAYCQIENRDDAQRIHEKVRSKVLALDPALDSTLPAFLALLDVPAMDAQWQALDPPQRRQRTLDACKRLFVRESQIQPLVLVFEDLHWIDTETQALLDSLTDSLPTAPLLLLVNYRPEYQHGWGRKTFYTQLRIDPLPAESADALLQALLGDDLGLGPLKRLLIDQTQGNPFFLEESVRTLIETRALVGDRGMYRLATALPSVEVPVTVQAVLASRIDRLGPEEKRLLQTAAVIGKDVPVTLLLAIADEAEENIRRNLATLQAAEFLYESMLFPELEYTFKHALTHEVTYAGLLQDRRRALHDQIVAAIERLYRDRLPEWVERLAHHAVRAENDEKAVDYLILAASKAYERGAVHDSAERFEQALGLADRLPQTPDNLRRQVDVRVGSVQPLFTTGQIPRVVDLIKGAEKFAIELDDQPRLGLALYRMAVMSHYFGDYQRASECTQQVLDIADRLAIPQLRVLGRHMAGMNHRALGQYRAAVDIAALIVDGPDEVLARQDLGLSLGTPYVMAAGLAGWALAEMGDFRRAALYCAKAGGEADASNHPPARAWAYLTQGFALGLRGEFERALRTFETMASICDTEGVTSLLSPAEAGRGWALAWMGRCTEGIPYLERGAKARMAVGFKNNLPTYFTIWAEGLLLGQQVGKARELGEEALHLAQALGERGEEARAMRVLATIAEVADSSTVASGLYQRAKAIAEECHMAPLVAHCHAGLGRTAMRRGDRRQARESLATATTMYREMGMRYWLEKAEAEMKELR